MSSQRWQGVSVVRLKQQHAAAQLAKQNSNEFKSSLLPGPALLNPAKSDQQLGNGIQIEAVVAPIDSRTPVGRKRNLATAQERQKIPQTSSTLSLSVPEHDHAHKSSSAIEIDERSTDGFTSPHRIVRICKHALNLDKIDPACGLEVELKWMEDADSPTTDFDSLDIPINPSPYDTPLSNSLPFDQNNNILLAKMKSTLNCRKFLWMSLRTKQLFWLIGYVPSTLSTWRDSMLRHCLYVITRSKGIRFADDDGTVLFSIAKRFFSKSPTMEDVMEQQTRMAGANKNRKCVLKVDKIAKTPQLKGIKWIPNSIQTLQSHQQVLNAPSKQYFRMGEGNLANTPVVPMQVSVAQVCQALPELDRAIQPPPNLGGATLKEAMMDVDCAVFAMSADTITMNSANSVELVVNALMSVIPSVEQTSNTMFIPSGVWQRKHDTGPTVRPVNGGNWWLLSSPKFTREPTKVWIHSPEFLQIEKLKSAAIEIAEVLFEKFDATNPERLAKLHLKNTVDEVKVPGGFLFPLALSVMASRIGTDVTIFLETFGNKSHGMKLNALDPAFGPFGKDNWAANAATSFTNEWKNSVLLMLTNLTDSKSGCFKLYPKHTSIGFGFSTTFCDGSNQLLFSVCKQEEWITSDNYEPFCTMALHSSMCPHTTHFRSGPVLRVQAYIEAFNCITEKQCGSARSHYSHIGFSALEKMSTGEINASAMLEGFNDDFHRINRALTAMWKSPRNRTEIQVNCVVDASGSLDLKSMIQTAANIILVSTQHWKLTHILSFSSLNAAAMFLIAQQSWRLACDVNVTLKQRQSLLDGANELLKRWKSFKTGRGDGTTGPKHNKTLIEFPTLCEPLLSQLDSMLPAGKRFHREDEPIRIFNDNDLVADTSFGNRMNDRIEENRKQISEILSSCILKCCTCGALFFGAANADSLEVHHADNPSCITSEWAEEKLVTAADWESDYLRRLQKYHDFLKSSSVEQKEACESILKFGSGILAVGIAGAGKSVALNQVGMILECIFYRPGEIIRCASTGLLAQYFNPAATTVHSAIGAHPSFGATPNWNLSVQGWRDLIKEHGKVTANLKVFINTEVYAESSNMLQALFEIRQEEKLTFLAILDGDPPQPMHEDDNVSDSQANFLLCGIRDHFLLNRSEIRQLLPDVRIVHFETPMRQKDPKVHELSTAVRYAKAEKRHIQMMRENEYEPKKHKVDIILCALRKHAQKINIAELRKLPGQEHQYFPKTSRGAVQAGASTPMILKIGAPVLFIKACPCGTTDTKKGKRKVVNGARGHVTSCDANGIFVALVNTKVQVRVEAIQLYDGKDFYQLPIQLGWATTIKKAAGMTFDAVAIDFGLDWTLDEARLIQSAKLGWRTSQVYGAITRPRNLAFFCNASKFKDAPMLALANNQNLAALEFLRNLTECQEQYVQTLQEMRNLSFQSDGTTTVHQNKKRKFHTCKLLDLTALCDADTVTDHVWAHQYPQTLARQAAGFYCTGVLTTNGNHVLIKTSNQMLQQEREIQVLKDLSGTIGVPELLGRAGEHLVLSHNGVVPYHGCLQSEHLENLQKIIDAIHSKGWTLEHVTRQNIWAQGNSVSLFNFENAAPITASSRLMKIQDFVQACDSNCLVEFPVIITNDVDDMTQTSHECGDIAHFDSSEDTDMIIIDDVPTDETKLQHSYVSTPQPSELVANTSCKQNASAVNVFMKAGAFGSVSAASSYQAANATFAEITGSRPAKTLSVADAAPQTKSYNADIRPREVAGFRVQKHFSSVLTLWNRETNEMKLERVSELWQLARAEVYPTHGPARSWESGLKGHKPKSLGYGEATSGIIELLCQVHDERSKSGSGCLPRRSFVDIGSGIGNIVLQMSALNPNFDYSFGIEIRQDRACFAQEACNVFTRLAVAKSIPFCCIQAQEGDCFKDTKCKVALKRAGLIWINNEIFEEQDQLKLYKLLNLLVPKGCIIISFKEIVMTKRTAETQPKDPSDFTVFPPRQILHSNSWEDPRSLKKVFIIQRTSHFYAGSSSA